MAAYILYIGNKNYSSWSLRAWLMARLAGIPFEEVLIPLYQPESRDALLRQSPTGKVPALHQGGLTVWDSLAIGEYLAEQVPAARLWPEDVAARAVARSVSAEMHAGFMPLRRHLPMNMRASRPDRDIPPEVAADIARIAALWRDCRARFGAGGDFLFGRPSLADAMYAPVASRFVTYGVALDREAAAYVAALVAQPAYQEWLAAARSETMRCEQFEV